MSNETHPHVQAWLDDPKNAGCQFVPETYLDENGRCCGRKPWKYKRVQELFCGRCHASFDLILGNQKPNWAYLPTIGGWVRFRHHAMYHEKPPGEFSG